MSGQKICLGVSPEFWEKYSCEPLRIRAFIQLGYERRDTEFVIPSDEVTDGLVACIESGTSFYSWIRHYVRDWIQTMATWGWSGGGLEDVWEAYGFSMNCYPVIDESAVPNTRAQWSLETPTPDSVIDRETPVTENNAVERTQGGMMGKQEELKVEFTKEELERIRDAAAAHGVDPETWAKEVILRLFRPAPMPSQADDTELIAEFFRTERESDETCILVRMISWRGAHTPTSTWVPGTTLSGGATDTEVDEAVRTLLQDSRFFATCRECCKRKPVGWMHDGHTCQACASRIHGFVY